MQIISVQLNATQSLPVVIDGWAIRQDAEGRYCLNDIHKASGRGDEKSRAPWAWQRTEGIAELIAGVLIQQKCGFSPIVSKAGRNGGTFAVKELVYAYAMWISAEYHLKVIQAYDRLATDGVAVHEDKAEALLEDPLAFLTIVRNLRYKGQLC